MQGAVHRHLHRSVQRADFVQEMLEARLDAILPHKIAPGFGRQKEATVGTLAARKR